MVLDPGALLGAVERPILRDFQLEEIRACFAGKVASIRPIHAWVYGPPGTGKTLCARYLLQQHAQPPNFLFIHVGCQEHFTFLSVIEYVLDQVKPLRVHPRTRQRQLALLRDTLAGRRSVIVLDEIDVLPVRDVTDLLHHLSVLPKTCLICIASSRQPLLSLPESVRSRLAPRQILFPRYRPDELRQILELTAQASLRPGSWTEEALQKLVDHSYGDARRMLALLRHGVQRAEEAGDKTLRPGHLKPSNFGGPHLDTEERLAQLSSHHQILHDIVLTRGPIASSPLEVVYRRACCRRGLEPVSPRTLVKYLTVLCRRQILSRERGAGTSGWIYRVAQS